MKRYFFLFIAIPFLTLTSCDHESSDCPTMDGICDNRCVETLITQLEVEQSTGTVTRDFAYLAEAMHKGEAVYILANCCPYCSSIFPVYDCSGNQIGHVDDNNFSPALLNNAKIIWRSENNQCSF